MKPSSIWPRLQGRLHREMARRLGRRLITIRADLPLISFTFDDFPRSALMSGGATLAHYGFAGTYYASFGLMGRDGPTGQIFEPSDLETLRVQGHELGCHTFDHCHAWDTPPFDFEASILRNQQAIAQLLPGVHFETFSYPISCPRPHTKRRTASHYRCSRGGGQTFNAGQTDMNYLNAFFIEQSRDDFDVIKRTIDANRLAKGWLIFATHDVADSPTRFGCTPRFFRQVVEYAAKSGAAVMPVREASRRIRTSLTG